MTLAPALGEILRRTLYPKLDYSVAKDETCKSMKSFTMTRVMNKF